MQPAPQTPYMKTSRFALTFVFAVCACVMSIAQLSPFAQRRDSSTTGQLSWIARSNGNAQVLLKVRAKYGPEEAARNGMAGLDEQVTVLASDRLARIKADTQSAVRELQRRLTAERDPLVAQDLQILIKAAQDTLRGQELNEKYETPYFNVPQMIFAGIRGLLDDQVPTGRQKAALIRLRKYAGIERGYEPLTEQAQARTRAGSGPGRFGPARVEVETDVARAGFFVNGIADLFAHSHIDGYQEPLAALKKQIAD